MTIKDRVLVVEDEKSISGLIKAILTANGYDVITASTGNEAFSMISSHCPLEYYSTGHRKIKEHFVKDSEPISV